MSNFKSRLTKQLNGLNDRDIGVFFYSYSTYDTFLYANDECTQYIDDECLHASDIIYNGDGLIQFSVYKFSDGVDSAIVKFHGTYESYNGAEYDGWEFVKAVQKTITEYE